MRRDDICLYLGPADRVELQALITNRNTPRKLVWRAEIVLATADAGTLIVPRSTNDYRWQKNAMAQARRIARQNQLRLLRVGHDPLQ